jgi:hypothetical protein
MGALNSILVRVEVAIRRVRSGLGSDGLDQVSSIKKLSDYRSSSGQPDPGRVLGRTLSVFSGS